MIYSQHVIDGYTVCLVIQPGREAPHVSWDSPRVWDPPRAPRLVGATVYDAHGCRAEMAPADRARLVEKAKNVEGVGGRVTAERRPAAVQMRLPLAARGA